MMIITSIHFPRGCCAICKYWYGEAVEKIDRTSGTVIYNSEIDDACQFHKKWTFSHEYCHSFILDGVYGR